MEERPRILVLTLSIGSGHIRAAEAISDSLKEAMPSAPIALLDALKNCRLLFRALYVWTYWALIRFASPLWRRYFAARVARHDQNTAPVAAWRWGCRHTFERISDFDPDLVVACEVGASEIAVIARRSGLTKAEIVCVITDFESEPIWAKPEVAAYAVADPHVSKQLQDWGVQRQKIKICGIPVDASFGSGRTVGNVRKMFCLSEAPIVLLMGGGMGPSRMHAVAEKLLLRGGQHFQIVALPGEDRSEYRKLKKLQETCAERLRVLEWTEEVAALMSSAAVLVTKPGGLTLAEAAASGLPMVLYNPIPGPEERNARRFCDAGAAILADSPGDAANAAMHLLDDAGSMERMKRSCAELASNGATAEIVALAIDRLSAPKGRGRIESVPENSKALECLPL